MIRNSRITRRIALLSFAVTVLLPPKTLAAWPLVTVHKDPTCGCCGGWIAHLELRGFQTKTIETTTINRVKAHLGIPFDLSACQAEVSIRCGEPIADARWGQPAAAFGVNNMLSAVADLPRPRQGFLQVVV